MKTKVILTISTFFLFFSSCNDGILEQDNPAQLSEATFFRSEDQALAAINAVYASLQGTNMYTREYFFFHDLLSDDVQSGGAQLEAARAIMLNYNFDGSNPVMTSVWRGMYRMILRSNFVIANIDEATNVSDELKARIKGEAHFFRAFAYFELVSMWGRVPLITAPTTSPEGTPRSSSEDEVYNLIFEDLEIAEQNLPVRSAYGGDDVGRVAKGTAQAMQAKVHLFRGDYQAARQPLLDVISSGEYRLIDDYAENFREENENNDESLFEVQFSRDFGVGGAWNGDGNGIAEITFRGQEYGPNAWRNLIPSDGLVAEYEEGDPRSEYVFYRIGDLYNNGNDTLTVADVQGNTDKPSWKKYQMIYKTSLENSQSGINFRVIRYADVLLMMAEVENELNGPAAALPYINQVRARPSVDMPLYPTEEYPVDTKEEMFDAIVHERRVELAGEQIRNRDIRRWRRLGKLDEEPISGFQSRHDLMPIPFEEIDNNSALTNADQNTGY